MVHVLQPYCDRSFRGFAVVSGHPGFLHLPPPALDSAASPWKQNNKVLRRDGLDPPTRSGSRTVMRFVKGGRGGSGDIKH